MGNDPVSGLIFGTAVFWAGAVALGLVLAPVVALTRWVLRALVRDPDVRARCYAVLACCALVACCWVLRDGGPVFADDP